MRVCTSLATIFLLAVSAPSSGSDRSFINENVGRVTLTAPDEWEGIERHHINFGTTFYRLVSKKERFDVEILVNDLPHMQMDALVDRDLERYISSNMDDAVPQSVEGRVDAIRFGAAKDGVYGRLTDKAPAPGEWKYFAQGVRLTNGAVVLFTLYSDDESREVLDRVLSSVESVSVHGK